MTYGLGHPINDRVQCTEVDPPIYVWESRPNPAIVVILLPAQRKAHTSGRSGWSLGRLPRTSVSEVDSPASDSRRIDIPASDSPASESSAGWATGGVHVGGLTCE